MNLAWDAFRIIDNHSKSMIFMMPDDPKNEEYATYIKAVTKPITLEAIRVKIQKYPKLPLFRTNSIRNTTKLSTILSPI